MAEQVNVTVRIGNEDLPEEVRNRLGQALQRELRGLRGVEQVEPATREAPDGARSGLEGFTWGALVLVLAPVALNQLIEILKGWSGRPGGQPTNVSIEIGDRKIESEYDPASMTPAEAADLAERLRDVIDG